MFIVHVHDSGLMKCNADRVLLREQGGQVISDRNQPLGSRVLGPSLYMCSLIQRYKKVGHVSQPAFSVHSTYLVCVTVLLSLC